MDHRHALCCPAVYPYLIERASICESPINKVNCVWVCVCLTEMEAKGIAAVEATRASASMPIGAEAEELAEHRVGVEI